jgi:hypothetical protein
VRRRLAFFLVVVGLVGLVTGLASGCGSFFSFNGRHPIAVEPLVPGTPLRTSFHAKAGKHYTLAVHVLFVRESAPESNGQLVVEAKLPLVAAFEDASGAPVAKVVGWLDPDQPPTVLYGHVTSANHRRPMGVGPAELVAERLIGPYTAPAERDVTYVVDLGPDRLGTSPIQAARVVVYDDALPTAIRVAFAGAGAGALALVTGLILLLFGLVRSRRGGTRRRQIV